MLVELLLDVSEFTEAEQELQALLRNIRDEDIVDRIDIIKAEAAAGKKGGGKPSAVRLWFSEKGELVIEKVKELLTPAELEFEKSDTESSIKVKVKTGSVKGSQILVREIMKHLKQS
ncbi:hypothetical protein [Candidatus Albibeggiatoa sp. nov. NOAA]|uniref:hypothetical protein n=1 Tax=Candidatus Albibeggiatoa sp. nov. NOAA TaxID=3162724 RepID=UPI0032F955AE|nr:hypothetical protein [Thiotrichaceae bacterium]